AIVDDPPKVELVIENSDPSQPIAVDRRGIPLAAARTRDRLAIKPSSDLSRRHSIRVLVEDALRTVFPARGRVMDNISTVYSLMLVASVVVAVAWCGRRALVLKS